MACLLISPTLLDVWSPARVEPSVVVYGSEKLSNEVEPADKKPIPAVAITVGST